MHTYMHIHTNIFVYIVYVKIVPMIVALVCTHTSGDTSHTYRCERNIRTADAKITREM